MIMFFQRLLSQVNFAKLAFFAWSASFVLILVLVFFPFEIVSLKSFQVTSPVVHAGQNVAFTLHFKKYIPLPGTVELFAVNSSPIKLESAGLYRKTGEQAILGSRHIPENTEEGIYHLEFHLKYTVVSFRPPIVYVWSSNSFFIKNEREN